MYNDTKRDTEALWSAVNDSPHSGEWAPFGEPYLAKIPAPPAVTPVNVHVGSHGYGTRYKVVQVTPDGATVQFTYFHPFAAVICSEYLAGLGPDHMSIAELESLDEGKGVSDGRPST